MKIETAPNRLLTATGADRDPLLGSGYIPSLNTPDDPLFPELDIDSTFLNAGNDDLIGDDDIDYDAAARQLLEQSGFVDVPAANTAPATPQSQPSTAIAIALDIPAVLEANRRTKSTAGAAATTSAFALPAPITLARGASVIPPGPPSLSSRPMVGEQRAHGERHKGLVMPRVVPSRTSLSGPSSASAQQGGQQQQQKTPDSASPISSNNNNNNNDPLPSLSIDRINEESRALLAHLLSGLTAPLMMQGSSSNSNNAVAATETSDQFGIDPRGLGGLPANTFPTPPEDHAMEERDLEEEEEEQEEDSEVDQVRMRVKREPDPDFAVPAPRTRSRSRTSINATKAAGSTSTARSSRRTSTTTTKPTSKPTRSRSTPSKPQYAATSDYDSDEFDNNSDDLDAPLHEITSLIASSHAHRGAPPHKSNQPIGETDDLQRRLDEDDRVIEAGGKGLSSKERRQLRNKISARNFRARRKEYIGTLEQQLLRLSSVHARLVEEHRLLKRQFSAVSTNETILCDSCGGDALRLAESTEQMLREGEEQAELRLEIEREEAGVSEKKGVAGKKTEGRGQQQQQQQQQQMGASAVQLPPDVAVQLQEALKSGQLKIGNLR